MTVPRLPSAADIGLTRIASRLPRHVEPVDDILGRAGYGDKERRVFKVKGLRDSPSLSPDERMEDLLVEAGRAALGGQSAGLVLYGHTLLLRQLDLCGEFRDRLRSRLGLPGSDFYGISHINCVSVLRSVELARRYLSRPGADPEDRVLVLGGDQASVNDIARVFPGMSVSGDSAVATLVQGPRAAAPPRYRYLGGAWTRDARFYRNRRMSPEEAEQFSVSCRAKAVEIVQLAAKSAGIAFDEVDWVMPQLSNRMLWTNFSSLSGYPWERICLDLLPERGHNFGTDSLMVTEYEHSTGRLRPGDRCALVAIGRGAYFEALILEVVGDS